MFCIFGACVPFSSSQDETWLPGQVPALSFLEDCSPIAQLLSLTASDELGTGDCQCSGRHPGRKQGLTALILCADEQGKLRSHG